MFRGGLFIRRKFSAILFYSCRGRMPVEAKERQLPVATSPNLDDMKLPELKELAKQMGLRGVSTMRKTELIATLQAARSGGRLDLFGVGLEHFGRESVFLRTLQRFAAQFEEYSLVFHVAMDLP